MTNHTNCLHPATPAGRAACRKAGSVTLFHDELAQKVFKTAPCEACFWNATESAAQNLADDLGEVSWEDREAYAIRRAQEFTHAREYLFDRSALSACSDHQDKLS